MEQIGVTRETARLLGELRAAETAWLSADHDRRRAMARLRKHIQRHVDSTIDDADDVKLEAERLLADYAIRLLGEDSSDQDDLTAARNYLKNEVCWRVEFNKSVGQLAKVHWFETTASDTESDVTNHFQNDPQLSRNGVSVVSVRRATVDDAEEMAASA